MENFDIAQTNFFIFADKQGETLVLINHECILQFKETPDDPRLYI